jgi:hypothetical protein
VSASDSIACEKNNFETSSKSAFPSVINKFEAKRNVTELSPNENISSTPQKKVSKDLTISSNSSSSKIVRLSTMDRDSVALNLNLENCILITLRQEIAQSNPSIRYIGTISSSDLLNSSNISELICTLLSQKSEVLNAVNYLTGSYKRLHAKESAVNDKLKEDLKKLIFLLLSCVNNILIIILHAVLVLKYFLLNSLYLF